MINSSGLKLFKEENNRDNPMLKLCPEEGAYGRRSTILLFVFSFRISILLLENISKLNTRREEGNSRLQTAG